MGSITIINGIEAYQGSNFDDSLTGNDENNYLLGEAGDDTLVGGGGEDVLDGGDGMDTAVYADHEGLEFGRVNGKFIISRDAQSNIHTLHNIEHVLFDQVNTSTADLIIFLEQSGETTALVQHYLDTL